MQTPATCSGGMNPTDVRQLKTLTRGYRQHIEAELESTGGVLRMAPCWVPRSFLQPGNRLKLAPEDLYAYGVHRGGIDERWFSSTIPAGNEGRVEDEGLSYVVAGDVRITLKDVI